MTTMTKELHKNSLASNDDNELFDTTDHKI
jgi:hypothetical protein